MSPKTFTLPDDLHAYIVANGSEPDELVRELIEVTRANLPAEFEMQVAPEQAALLTMLVQILGVRQAVEIGTFTGLSSIAIARGLVDGGRLICLDVSQRYTDIARQYWQRAGLSDRVELRLGPATTGLAALPPEPHLDFAFVDAGKTEYAAYWQELVPRMRLGGVIAVDNVLRHGRVLNPAPDDVSTHAILRFNQLVLDDKRVESVMVPIADGLTLARRVS
jgi:caffeoyl-CoA O-methyltransferase